MWPKFLIRVCGAVSKYGTLATVSHGIPATTAGQPGHCAWLARKPEGGWGIHNNVSGAGHTHPHHAFYPGFEGMARMDYTYGDSAAVRRAARCLWLSRLLQSAGYGTPQIAAVYEQALAAQASYAVEAYGEWIKTAVGTTDATWGRFLDGVLSGLTPYPTLAWELVHKFAIPSFLGKLPTERKLDYLVRAHEVFARGAGAFDIVPILELHSLIGISMIDPQGCSPGNVERTVMVNSLSVTGSASGKLCCPFLA